MTLLIGSMPAFCMVWQLVLALVNVHVTSSCRASEIEVKGTLHEITTDSLVHDDQCYCSTTSYVGPVNLQLTVRAVDPWVTRFTKVSALNGCCQTKSNVNSFLCQYTQIAKKKRTVLETKFPDIKKLEKYMLLLGRIIFCVAWRRIYPQLVT